jgi:aspartate 1-decarboxylase
MRRQMLKSKIHRARITGASLHYEGSLTIDALLMEAADILPHESVDIWNVTRGSRLRTYAIPGPPGSKEFCANGAAAHHIHEGDLVIIATFADMDEEEARNYEPAVLLMDGENNLVDGHYKETPGPASPPPLP